jgi:hypothetical protein
MKLLLKTFYFHSCLSLQLTPNNQFTVNDMNLSDHKHFAYSGDLGLLRMVLIAGPWTVFLPYV